MDVAITRISQTKQGYFALFQEEEFLFSVDGETLVKNDLHTGVRLTQETLAAIKQQSDLRKAKDKALAYLSLRDYAGGELYDKLCLKFDAHSAAAAVAEMQRLALLDDAAFALHRAQYLAGQNKSTREIARVLQQKGIDRETVAHTLEQLAPQDADACCAVIRKSYLRKLQAGKREQVIAALARRGFAYGDIKKALAQCETGGEDSLFAD